MKAAEAVQTQSAGSGRTDRTGRAVVLGAIRVYRAAISPMHPPTCRYVPTCSEFALIAVERFGVARGGWLALRRLLRCHPLHAGGYDPVPDVRARATRTA